jgi:hypothetical protein
MTSSSGHKHESPIAFTLLYFLSFCVHYYACQHLRNKKLVKIHEKRKRKLIPKLKLIWKAYTKSKIYRGARMLLKVVWLSWRVLVTAWAQACMEVCCGVQGDFVPLKLKASAQMNAWFSHSVARFLMPVTVIYCKSIILTIDVCHHIHM